MKVLHSVKEMRAACKDLRRSKGADSTLALVPTMGALHEGHLSLVRAARRQCELIAVSIFVNPIQFGPNEDFSRYPRTWDTDCELLQEEGVDLLFAPTVAEMYPHGQVSSSAATFVDVPGISERLDGASRPGHFRGVATVVTKLFHIVMPDKAFFGQKDAAQVAVLRAMVRDLDLPVQLVTCPTVRDADGLALSSRNRYLSAAQRKVALALPAALQQASSTWLQGVNDACALKQAMCDALTAAPDLRIDYAEVVDPDTLLPLESVADGALLAIAAWVGKTRLIDNLLIASPATGEQA